MLYPAEGIRSVGAVMSATVRASFASTVDRRSSSSSLVGSGSPHGVMVFFNDPLPVESHELQAVRLALAVQARFGDLADAWRKRGIELGLGIGIEAGYATLGRIGFEGRFDYGALGQVTNFASRLSTSASEGQTLIGQRGYAATEEVVETIPVGILDLKGFGRPVTAYEVRRSG
jgi:adenylate cyclase